MEFDADGNYLRGWGGEPADGSYEWPADEHGIHVDYKGNVWVSSAGGPRMGEGTENFLLKFTADGKFLLQVGRRGMSKGSLDTATSTTPPTSGCMRRPTKCSSPTDTQPPRARARR